MNIPALFALSVSGLLISLFYVWHRKAGPSIMIFSVVVVFLNLGLVYVLKYLLSAVSVDGLYTYFDLVSLNRFSRAVVPYYFSIATFFYGFGLWIRSRSLKDQPDTAENEKRKGVRD